MVGIMCALSRRNRVCGSGARIMWLGRSRGKKSRNNRPMSFCIREFNKTSDCVFNMCVS